MGTGRTVAWWGMNVALIASAGGAASPAAAFAQPAVPADAPTVRRGADAWAAGDYQRALGLWRPLAAAGDPDAQYNLAQAYRLGRGVPADPAPAREWYLKAARQGHAQSQANYGLMLFQAGDRRNALPWLVKAADRGEARAQYVVGTALFNGDVAGRDWVRAYAMMTRAAAAGLPQATASLAEMDRFVPLAQRTQGTALARDLERSAMLDEAGAPPGTLVGAGAAAGDAHLAVAAPEAPSRGAPPADAPAGAVQMRERASLAAVAPPTTPAFEATTPPRPRGSADAPAIPSEPARRAAAPPPVVPPATTGTGRALASDTATRAAASTPASGTRAVTTAAMTGRPGAVPSPAGGPAPAPARPAKAVAALRPAGGGWRVQVGAFSTAAAAAAAWQGIAARVPGLALQPYQVATGRMTRLQAGPLAGRAEADRACARIRAAAAIPCFTVPVR